MQSFRSIRRKRFRTLSMGPRFREDDMHVPTWVDMGPPAFFN
jgi:hypothetical protein